MGRGTKKGEYKTRDLGRRRERIEAGGERGEVGGLHLRICAGSRAFSRSTLTVTEALLLK